MTTWIALLRGINVGGHKKVPMAELRALCAGVGFHFVATHIQSGNVVFRAEGTASALGGRLAEAVRERFGFDVAVMARSRSHLERVVRGNPYLGTGLDPKTFYVGFLGDTPSQAKRDDMPEQPPGPEEFQVVGEEIFLVYPEGVGRSKLTGAWLERALGVPVTVRNWRTVNKLLEMARAASAGKGTPSP